MRYVIVLMFLAVLASGCNRREEELEGQKNALETANRQLTQEITTRDQYVDSVADAINQVYASIEQVHAQEKSLVKEAEGIESKQKGARGDARAKVIDEITSIRSRLSDDYKRIAALQSKLSAASSRYNGLKTMVASLKRTIEERDSSIVDLSQRIEGLQTEVAQKQRLIVQRDSVIDNQYRKMITVYYISGTRDELEKLGIIRKEGGFPWGWFGSTTVMAGSVDEKSFRRLNMSLETSIRVNGKIEEIVPKRDLTYYRTEIGKDNSRLTIDQPENFWKEKYLVIVTDKPALN